MVGIRLGPETKAIGEADYSIMISVLLSSQEELLDPAFTDGEFMSGGLEP